MITDVHERRLLVTSDTHIGNLFCDARPGFIRLLDYARANKYNVCINGDGIDVLQTSVRKMTGETPALLREFRRIASEITIYYTVGNHDIILEHCLGDWGGLRFVPFLNVTSGTKRIRIEHGHLYDPAIISYNPQHGFTWFVSTLFRLYPPAYHWHAKYEAIKYRRVNRNHPAGDSPLVRDVSPTYLEAAQELSQRGFDAVIFGHTHFHGVVPLNGTRARYFNTGSWFGNPHFITIEDGEIELRPWVG
jgi:UDP-2,3-diacylglucosamine pyrophosphatase LpxH